MHNERWTRNMYIFTITYIILGKDTFTHCWLWCFSRKFFRISIRARCTTLCDKVCHWLVTGRWFSPGPPVSSTYKTDRYNITEILLKVAFNTIAQSNKHPCEVYSIQHYVIKFVSDLRRVGGSPVFSTNKTDCQDIAEILLKVALNTKTLTYNSWNRPFTYFRFWF